MEDRRTAILPNCLCNPAIAAVRVSDWGYQIVGARGVMEVVGVLDGKTR
jgi:hypothetical protein